MSEFIVAGVNLIDKNEILSIGYDAKFDNLNVKHFIKIKYKKWYRRSEVIRCVSKEEVNKILDEIYKSLVVCDIVKKGNQHD